MGRNPKSGETNNGQAKFTAHVKQDLEMRVRTNAAQPNHLCPLNSSSGSSSYDLAHSTPFHFLACRSKVSRPPLFNPQHHLLSRCDSGILSVDSLPKCETNLVFKRLALLCYRGKLRNQSRRKRPAYVPNCRINYLSSTTSRFISQ